MRLIALLVATALVLSGCDKQPEKHDRSRDGAPTTTVQATDKVAPDPIVVAGATIVLANEVSFLFREGRRDHKKIRKKLDEIAAQNSQILEKLGQIVNILNNLGVTIRQNVRLETIFEKQATLSALFRQTFETWASEIDDTRVRETARRLYTTDILPGVKTISRELMDEGYGYTAFNSVGHSMLAEFWMSWRVGEAGSIRKQRAITYLAYFDRALDPKHEATPAQELAEAVAQRDRMKAILDSADSRIGSNGWTVEVRRWRDYVQRGCGYDWYDKLLTHTAAGNQRDGYRLVDNVSILKQGREKDCCNKNCKLNLALVNDDPPTPTANTPASMVPYWQAARSTYISASAKAETMTKVVEALKVYRAEADRIRQTG